jgi:hypothetical protein
MFAAVLDLELADLPALREHLGELQAMRPDLHGSPIRLVVEALAGYLDVLSNAGKTGLARIDATAADPGRYAAPGIPAMLLRIRLAACQQLGDGAGSAETARRLLADPVRVWDPMVAAVLREER